MTILEFLGKEYMGFSNATLGLQEMKRYGTLPYHLVDFSAWSLFLCTGQLLLWQARIPCAQWLAYEIQSTPAQQLLDAVYTSSLLDGML